MNSEKRIIGLDLVRFLAALGIVAYHYFFIGPIQGFYANDVFQPAAFWGEFGVDIFFILSGAVILFSTERKNTPYAFLKGRIFRIYPAFMICSGITVLTGMIMPGTAKRDLMFRWINSLTLCNDLWGVQPLSSIYWTLMVEMKFYILAAIIMKLGIWAKYKYHILFSWTCLGILNAFGMKWTWLDTVLNTKYAGHFTLGIIICLLYKGQKNRIMLPILGESIWLIYRNCISYTEWIRGIYEGGGANCSDIDILFVTITIALILYFAAGVTSESKTVNRMVPCLGAWSYTIYLLHADFGYFIRTQYYNRLIVWAPKLADVVNEHIIMAVAVMASLVLSYAVLQAADRIGKMIVQRFGEKSRD